MPEEKTRVDFNAPASLVRQADRAADVLGVSRTRLLVDALRDELDELRDDDGFRQRLRTAYYEGRVGFETLESLLGREEALRTRLLGESMGRQAPEPVVPEEGVPSAEVFYDEPPTEWLPNTDSDAGSDESAGE